MHSLFHSFLDFILPLRCLKCGDLVEGQAGLCATCWGKIPFITKPFCACCGAPFDFDIEDGALCASCSFERPLYTSARSVFVYTDDSKDLVLKFKHLDHLSAVPLFAHWMASLSTVEGDVVCIPAPLHWTRLFRRTYNQAALLARKVAYLKGWTYAPSLLIRSKRTPSQGHLSREERLQNVKNAFAITPSQTAFLKGKTIALIDDMFTTGATLNGCAQTLLKAGAREIHALTLARSLTSRRLP